jgi:diamine N-acetyltransferase
MMILLSGEKIVMRSVDFSDVDTILLWENSNNEPLYGIFEERYTRKNVELFVMLQMQYSLEQTEQLRLMICSHEGERLGCIDLTEYDGRKAFVSILIFDLHNRRKGFGGEALQLLISYAKSLGMRSLYATILPQNEQSLHLFERAGFEDLGTCLYRKKLL